MFSGNSPSLTLFNPFLSGTENISEDSSESPATGDLPLTTEKELTHPHKDVGAVQSQESHQIYTSSPFNALPYPASNFRISVTDFSDKAEFKGKPPGTFASSFGGEPIKMQDPRSEGSEKTSTPPFKDLPPTPSLQKAQSISHGESSKIPVTQIYQLPMNDAVNEADLQFKNNESEKVDLTLPSQKILPIPPTIAVNQLSYQIFPKSSSGVKLDAYAQNNNSVDYKPQRDAGKSQLRSNNVEPEILHKIVPNPRQGNAVPSLQDAPPSVIAGIRHKPRVDTTISLQKPQESNTRIDSSIGIIAQNYPQVHERLNSVSKKELDYDSIVNAMKRQPSANAVQQNTLPKDNSDKSPYWTQFNVQPVYPVEIPQSATSRNVSRAESPQIISVYGPNQRPPRELPSIPKSINSSSEETKRPEMTKPPTQDAKQISSLTRKPDEAPRKSYQFRALSRKALRQQREHWLTNICCVGICPFVMIAVSTLIGTIVQNVILQGPAQEIVYCSKVSYVTAFTTAVNTEWWPVYNVSSTFIPKTDSSQTPRAKSNKILNVNFLDTQNLIDLAAQGLNQLVISDLGNTAECSNWFGKDYPPGFEVSRSKASLPATSDSVYAYEISSGWLGLYPSLTSGFSDVQAQAFNLFRSFLKLQQKPWAYIASDPSTNPSILGSAPKEDLIGPTQLPQYRSSLPNFKTASAANGILDTIEPRWYAEISDMVPPNKDVVTLLPGIKFRKVPYFLSPAPNSVLGAPADQNTLNEQLIKSLQNTITGLSQLDKSVLSAPNPRTRDVISFYLNASTVMNDMPTATIYFSNVDPVNLVLSATLQIGTDSRLQAYPAFPTKGMRRLVHLTQLTNGFLRYTNPGQLGSTVITQGVRVMPVLDSTRFDISYSGTIGKILYPFGISFLLPMFCLALVREKEERIRIMMRMNGLHTFTYFVSHYVTFYALYMISTGVFIATGFAFNLTLFVRTDAGLLLLIFFLWGHLQIIMSFVFASIFKSSRNAFVYVFLIVLCGVIISISVDQLFLNDPVPFYYLLWPPFAFYRALSLLNYNSYVKALKPYTMARLTMNDQLSGPVLAMSLETVVLLFITWYLDSVFPGEFGVPRPWHFPISDHFPALLRVTAKGQSSQITKAAKSQSYPSQVALEQFKKNSKEAEEGADPEMKAGDADVQAERNRVLSTHLGPESVVVIKRLRKVYAAHGGIVEKVAVRDITLALEKDCVFGLLGPNGAGKTTLISILNGLFEISSGQATLAGYDLATQTDSIYKCIGVCPQFDILWSDLTVEDHLYFYARLKGISPKQEDEVVKESLALVYLTGLEKRQARRLSGGEKRRLSIAIAFLGQPKVVFMDEPTTGLDPEVRRSIWDIIESSKQGKAIILTTHSMEEAEACCQRIGIMANGSLQCVGTQVRLKQLYGYGFNITFSVNFDQYRGLACAWVEQLLPYQQWERVDQFAATVTYRFMPNEGDLATIFASMEQEAALHHIDAWGVSQASMEDVFVRIVSQAM